MRVCERFSPKAGTSGEHPDLPALFEHWLVCSSDPYPPPSSRAGSSAMPPQFVHTQASMSGSQQQVSTANQLRDNTEWDPTSRKEEVYF